MPLLLLYILVTYKFSFEMFLLHLFIHMAVTCCHYIICYLLNSHLRTDIKYNAPLLNKIYLFFPFLDFYRLGHVRKQLLKFFMIYSISFLFLACSCKLTWINAHLGLLRLNCLPEAFDCYGNFQGILLLLSVDLWLKSYFRLLFTYNKDAQVKPYTI